MGLQEKIEAKRRRLAQLEAHANAQDAAPRLVRGRAHFDSYRRKTLTLAQAAEMKRLRQEIKELES